MIKFVHNLLLLLSALCVAELVHNLVEIWGIIQKVQWLKLSLKGKAHNKWPINIDSKFKVLSVHFLLLILTSGLAWSILQLSHLSDTNLTVISICTLLLSYILTVIRINRFHSDIDPLIK